ncbi:SIMPL domain-containing protein [Rhodococcus sp. HM1]|uniref:SIMPL domain-containing protein n=1 Tax=unclassified Rhodococcus (in: high G+C Gram-positive bacteria) TaxID=192944 RepID=UPI0018CCE15A|nr:MULTISPECIES: SIMPL domain-containing protein [unclassified Rhodococcus (in: high G+C Gram-positive bacteria)]MBH0120981.1 SIMPL domain-containing protein [Rhodococcus sp. CX]MCK8674043.1 SIMPL domain-containing protein [Rhodococcus sp. HM1]
MNDLPVTITVAGHAEREYAPNRCTVALQVHADGATREQAADPVAVAIATVTGLVTELRERPDSPVKRWTFDQVRHTRYRPYNNEGKTLPWRYTSSASITVTFHEFDAVAAFVDRVSGIEAVTVSDLRWWITRKSRQRKLAEVRDLAVQNALDKAKGYTKSLGYNTFRAVAIADPGMLGLPTPPTPYPGGGPVLRSAMRAEMAPASAESGPTFALEPDRIGITADVEARFEAS